MRRRRSGSLITPYAVGSVRAADAELDPAAGGRAAEIEPLELTRETFDALHLDALGQDEVLVEPVPLLSCRGRTRAASVTSRSPLRLMSKPLVTFVRNIVCPLSLLLNSAGVRIVVDHARRKAATPTAIIASAASV